MGIREREGNRNPYAGVIKEREKEREKKREMENERDPEKEREEEIWKTQGYSPVFLAVCSENEETLKFVLREGADPNQKSLVS